MDPKTSERICDAIALDLKARKITHQQVADMIGKTKATVSTQISGKNAFSKEMAKLFSDALGYSLRFLLYGEGELIRNTGAYFSEKEPGELVLRGYIDVLETIIHYFRDKDAIEAMNALRHGNFDAHVEAMKRFQKQHGTRMYSPVIAKYVCEHIGEDPDRDMWFPPVADLQ